MTGIGARFGMQCGSGAMIIAIDGPAASGKGTLAKRIADHLGLPCLDTGLLYRAVARDVAARGFRLDDRWAAPRRGPQPRRRQPSAIRGCAAPQAGDAASIVARIPEVRAALLAYQRAFAAPARRRRARRPRHRHRRLPGRRRQDLRHRHARGPRQAPFPRAARPAPRPSPSRHVLADIVRRDERDAAPRQRPHAPCPRRRSCSTPRTWI